MLGLLDSVNRKEQKLNKWLGPQRQKMGATDYSKYRYDPVSYARQVLGVQWWSKQIEIAEALLEPPHRVLVKASHKVGKTHLAGGLVNWWYDTRNPSVALTTAPTDRQVRDLLWKEVRKQRKKRGGFRGPKMPRLEDSANHWAHGFTARDGNSFQGQHEADMLIIFDEAVGVDSEFWETSESMFSGEHHAWLAIFNPTDLSSQAYAEELSGAWNVISISTLDHPNIKAESEGQSPPYPAAIRFKRLDKLIRKWCRKVEGEVLATDIEWPPKSGKYWRPGPIAEARLLGRWPSQATNNVWSDGAWQAAEFSILRIPKNAMPEIGCDVARYGDDFTAIHIRKGPVSLHHESFNGWSTSETAGRLKQLANKFGSESGIAGRRVLVKIDDDGVGGAVIDQSDGYNFVGISAASNAIEIEKYPNRRSELWFVTAKRASEGRLSLMKLDIETRREMRRQAMAPTWKLDSSGRRVVEPKINTKKRLKRSPDDIDAFNLSYAPVKPRPGYQVVTQPIVFNQWW